MTLHLQRLVVCVGLAAFGMGCAQESGPGFSGSRAAASARAQGAKEAKDYAATGKLKLKEYPPLPSPPQHGIYVQLLRERHGIEYEVPKLPKGMAEPLFIEQVRGWNAVMETEIEKKFGAGVVSKLRIEAEKLWREKVNQRGKAGNKPDL